MRTALAHATPCGAKGSDLSGPVALPAAELTSDARNCAVKHLDEPVDLALTDHERRRHGKHVAPERPDDGAAGQGFEPDSPGRSDRRVEGSLRNPVRDQLDAGQKTEATHVANDLVPAQDFQNCLRR